MQTHGQSVKPEIWACVKALARVSQQVLHTDKEEGELMLQWISVSTDVD